MQIAFVRHGIAVDREVYHRKKKPDSERPLTALGKRRMHANSSGILELLPKFTLIVSSPLTRAKETAEILHKRYPRAKLLISKALVPTAAPQELLRVLQKNRNVRSLALIGHEPHLSQVISFLTFGKKTTKILLKKGAVCVVEFPSKLAAGEARIACLIQPRILRKIKK